jgi:hypothetical protein
VKRLLAFGRFAHDPQGILAAIYRLALVCIELRLDLLSRVIKILIARQKGLVAVLASACHWVAESNDAEATLWHGYSLAHLARRA